MKLDSRLVVVPATVVLAAGVGAGAYALGSAVSRDVPEVVTPDTTFVAFLTGDQETPNAGDPDGSGEAVVRIDLATNEICLDLTTTNIDDLTGLHIHNGPPGVAGPIVVDFAGSGPPQVTNRCVTSAQAPAIAANPVTYYVNAHTAPYPSGAIRGQLEPEGSSTYVLPTPVRAFDSRQPNTQGQGALTAGSTTVVDLTTDPTGAIGAIPPDATAAIVTVTITETGGAGFLSVYSNALATAPATSTINWTQSGQDVAVTTTVKIDATDKVKITVGPNGTTDVILDVVGYLAP
jgi:hypothetical protein